ncbi:hypothetical protein V6N12_021995 [Hibiscus sabdariffa]|uniref:Uncharacterized protein n=1 Tax=Hibiscus sabdariffa TaxID=183260 RepID=A0ABR2FTG8_9ROSI
MHEGFDYTLPPMHYVLFVASMLRIWIIFYVTGREVCTFLLGTVKERCTIIFNSEGLYQEDILIRENKLLANVNASISLAGGQATRGGVFRDENGNWINGFIRDIGRSSVLLAELWTVHDSLTRA